MGKQNLKKLAKQFIGKPLPQVEAMPSDATNVQKVPVQKKAIGNYKKVDSRKADLVRSMIPLPDNMSQLAAKLTGDARMSNSSLDDEQKVILWDVMQNAKNRTGNPNGGTEYQDYGGIGYGSSDDFNNWWNKGAVSLGNVFNSFTNPGYELSSTVGRGRYWSDPENPDKMYYTDVYDWNKGEKNFKGSSIYQKVRNTLREGEEPNLNKDKNENYRMNFELDRNEIEAIRKKLKNEKELPIDAYLDRNGGWLDKYNDGGPVQPNYNDASVSMSDNFVGDGYSNVGRNYSPAWGGQFQKGGKLPMYVSDKNDPRLKAYKDSLDVRTRSDQTFKPGSKTRPLTKKEQVFWKDEKTGLAPNLVERIGPGQDYFGHFKKPTQPVEYRPEPTPQSTIDWIEGNGYSEEYIPNVQQPTNVNPFGFIEDRQTGYMHRYRTSTGELEMPFKGGQRYIQPKMAVGGSIPGAVGFTYARTQDPAPSNGKYAKKTMASAQNGTEMEYYQNGLDFQPKSISKNGKKVIKDDRGQWDHPGEITEIGSNQITMQGVPYPVLGISDTGDTQMMYPNQEYQYDGSSVTEYPMAQNGMNILNAAKAVGNYMINEPDSNAENVAEIIDPLGTSSWDDIARSYNKTGLSGETAFEAFGAIPMLGKLKKAGQFLDIIGKAIPKTGRQARNLKASVNTIKATGKYGPSVGRASDAYQAYNQYEQGGQLTKLDQLTNFTNYNTKQPGGWLDKYQD